MGHKDIKLSLSGEDLTFLEDVTFFVKKRRVIQAIIEMLGELEVEYHEKSLKYPEIIPSAALKKRGKISRGENYKGLPYVILDHPAVFGKEGIFAFRTLVWWGNPLSITFHISGTYLQQYIEQLSSNLSGTEYGNYHICVNTNQFEHHYEKSNYISLNEFKMNGGNIHTLATKNGFLKIAHIFPAKDIYLLGNEGCQFMETLLKAMC